MRLALALIPVLLSAQIPPPPGTDTPPLLIEKAPVIPLPAANDVPVFSEAGVWGQMLRYSISVCNPGSATLSLYGSTIWSTAQRQNLRPLTNAQLVEYRTKYNRMSAWAVLRTVLLVGSGATTALQAGGALGDKWQDQYKVIAPAIGTVMTIAELALSRHSETLELPEDYLPSAIQVPPGACWVGVLIGAP